MDRIGQIKADVKMQSWAAMIRECKSSGQSVKNWCAENGISRKTYYYRLRKVREMLCDDNSCEQHKIAPLTPSCIANGDSEQHQIVPLSLNRVDEGECNSITITSGRVSVVLPQSISTDKLTAVLEALKC